MGLLDDAIREHLELKLRHGASESEVSRLADEVLGSAGAHAPARTAARSISDAGPRATEEDDLPEEDLAEDAGFDVPPPREPVAPEPETPAGPPPDFPDEPLPEEELVEDAGFDVPPPREAAGPKPFTDAEPWLDDPDEVPDEEALEHRDSGIAARSISDFEGPEEDEAAEDVLEETPDFLQETPEHDRLWFEQKPPRDFDLGN